MSGVPFCLISMSMSVWLSAMKRLFTVMTCKQSPLQSGMAREALMSVHKD